MPHLEALLKLIPVEHHARAEALVLNIRDKQEQAIERTTESSEDLTKQIIESIGDVFWSTDVKKSVMEYISPAYERIWGRTTPELLENPGTWLDAVHPEDRERITEALSKQPLGTYNEVYRIVRLDGEERWIRDRAFPITDAKGNVTRIVGIATDITEGKQLEAQLRHSQKLESIGRLAGGVAHELNNALTPVLAFAEFAREELAAILPLANPNVQTRIQAVGADIEEILRAANRGKETTNSLRTFARKDILQQVKNTDFDSYIKGLHAILSRSVEGTYDFKTNYGSNSTVRLHPSLSQVLLNLVLNAQDSMQGGGTITIETSKIELFDNKRYPDLEPGPYATVSVTDEGSGIPQNILPHIFEPFYTTKGDKGTGLGLMVSYGIVKDHKGHIAVNSVVGEGTTFTVYLPIQKAPAEDPVSAKPVRTTVYGKTILVIEDEEGIRNVMQRALSRQGHCVVPTADIYEAKQYANIGSIDLIISDIMLPGGYGPEGVRDIRQQHPNVPVIYMTGYTDEKIAEMGITTSEGIFLHKPFSLAELFTSVEEAMKRKP